MFRSLPLELSVAGVLLPLLTNILIDRRKWSRERKGTIIGKIDQTGLDLLASLNTLWALNFKEAAPFATNAMNLPELNSVLMSRFSAWEQAVWVYMDGSEKVTVRNMRKEILEMLEPPIEPDDSAQMHYTDWVHNLSNSAKTRVK